jgi:hypothetical protein
MTREEWINYHLARAPKITARQWAETLLLLKSGELNNQQARKKSDKQESPGLS